MSRARTRLAWLLAGAGLGASGCAPTPFSYLTAEGPAAGPVTSLAWGLGGVALAVVAIITIALALAIWRRRPALAEGEADISRSGAGLAWIYGGLVASVVVLAACTVWTLVVLARVTHPATPPRLTIQVTAHQWWWEVRYLTPLAGRVFITANEIHIPAGEPVRVELSSDDVIHSFWVPRLAGKMDVIPGVTNVTWIQADAPGRFAGECGEFCGAQHARMGFQVVADTRANFDAWWDRQLVPPPGAAANSPGARIFEARCGACHTVRGSQAGGVAGPDLTHVGGRATLAAGLMPNTPLNMAAWITNPQAIKPDTRMPQVPMTATDRWAVVAYLQSLK